MTTNKEKYLPKHNQDNFHIDELMALPDKEFSEIYEPLFKWLHNMNHPVSSEVADVLTKRHKVIKTFIKERLEDVDFDPVWKYNVIRYVIANFNSDDRKYYEEVLSRIANNPTDIELYAEVNNIANDVLNK